MSGQTRTLTKTDLVAEVVALRCKNESLEKEHQNEIFDIQEEADSRVNSANQEVAGLEEMVYDSIQQQADVCFAAEALEMENKKLKKQLKKQKKKNKQKKKKKS